jgi:hypothetical protein
MNRLIKISSAAKCKVRALRVQKPFHTYEDKVYKTLEEILPPVQSVFVEPSSKHSHQGSSQLLTAGTAVSFPFSPERK